jgi:hypothetical protein
VAPKQLLKELLEALEAFVLVWHVVVGRKEDVEIEYKKKCLVVEEETNKKVELLLLHNQGL